MNARPRVALTLAALLACLLLFDAGWAAARTVQGKAAEVTGPVWPAPPEPARIRFTRSVGVAADWGLARNWWGRVVDTLTGRHEALFVRPTGVAEKDGVLYVADAGAQTLVMFDAPRHKELRIQRAGDLALLSPVAVAPGPDGTVYVADSRLQQVLQLDRDGALRRAIADGGLQRPSSVAFDATTGRLYVGDSKAHVVHVFDAQGSRLGTIGALGAGPGEFNSPTHLAVARDGRLVVTDALNFRVQVFDAQGRYLYRLGELGDGAGNFSAPKGVAADRAGHIYAADAMFDAVQVFNDEGRLLLGFGEQGTQPGQFWLPNGLYVNGSDQLFVADAYNRRIQVFQLLTPGLDAPAGMPERRGNQP